MKINFTKLSKDAVTPKRAHDTDAGFDLVAIECDFAPGGMFVCKTGIAVEIPPGFFGAIFPRSSIRNTPLILSNCVGVIDSGYRGEIVFSFRWVNTADGAQYKAGDRIGQLVILPLPEVEFEEVLVLSESKRGTCGFGSTGK
jgi:dUTP pyrophosphatase